VLVGPGRPERDHLAVAAHRLELERLDREAGSEPRGGEAVVGDPNGQERQRTR
jgi:hypothetical protein